MLRRYAHQLLIDGHFNADPHPGNIMVCVDTRAGVARPVLLDFGMLVGLQIVAPAPIYFMKNLIYFRTFS